MQTRMRTRGGEYDTIRIGRQRVWGRDFYHAALSIRWPAFLSWVLLVYLVINALFGIAYYFCGQEAFEGMAAGDGWHHWLECFFFSVQTLGTIGYGKISPATYSSNILVTIEALAGILFLALSTGLIFSRFSRPTARVVFSNVALITSHDGVPSLIFRIANERENQIVDADLQVFVVRTEKTAEGDTYYTFNDLKLERSHSPVFAASWTVVHPIDVASPLYGRSKQHLIDEEAEIVVSFKGIDETFAQPIFARFSYAPDEIAWNHRFVDMLEWKDNALSVHLERIHETMPV